MLCTNLFFFFLKLGEKITLLESCEIFIQVYLAYKNIVFRSSKLRAVCSCFCDGVVLLHKPMSKLTWKIKTILIVLELSEKNYFVVWLFDYQIFWRLLKPTLLLQYRTWNHNALLCYQFYNANRENLMSDLLNIDSSGRSEGDENWIDI